MRLNIDPPLRVGPSGTPAPTERSETEDINADQLGDAGLLWSAAALPFDAAAFTYYDPKRGRFGMTDTLTQPDSTAR
jgi:hypothetical protein